MRIVIRMSIKSPFLKAFIRTVQEEFKDKATFTESDEGIDVDLKSDSELTDIQIAFEFGMAIKEIQDIINESIEQKFLEKSKSK